MTARPSSHNHSLTDFAVERILQYIHENNLVEGDLLPSAEFFCGQLNISRVSFREAMSQLKGMRLIDSSRGKGFVLSAGNIHQLYELILPIYLKKWDNMIELAELRTVQELGAFPLAVLHIQEPEIQKLEQVVDEMFAVVKRPNFLSGDYIRLDAEFHQTLCASTQNRLLEIVSRHYFHYWLECLKTVPIDRQEDRDTLYNSTLSHRTIVIAIRQRDTEVGLLALYKHYQKLLNSFQS